MNNKHLLGFAVSLVTLVACGAQGGNGEDNRAQGVDQGTERDVPVTNSTADQGADAAAGAETSEGSYVGSWHSIAASPQYEAFMRLEANQGALCVSDGKSQTRFELVQSGGQLRMGDYDYGSGDLLELVGGGQMLQRTGEDKGVTYVDTYERWDAALPSWCEAQLAALD